MDVRCEKCLTVYELDDAKVGDAGLTVKCQDCGNLFKVRRRSDTAEMVVRDGDDDSTDPAEAITDPVAMALTTPVHGGPANALPANDGHTRRLAMPDPPARTEDRMWMLRSAKTAEVSRFRELTTLQQWIVERKVTRDDEISRGGESWKPLGGIAELASFFHVVDQAEALAHPGPAQPLADLATEMLPSQRRSTAPSFRSFAADEPRDEHEEDAVPTRSGRGVLGFAFVLVLVLVGVGSFFGYRFWRARTAGPSANDIAAQVAPLLERGRIALRSDTDDGFREAISVLDRAVELAPTSLAARVDLGEAHITSAAYLLEDAHALEAGGSAADTQAARTLRTDAHSHLERARRVLEEPSGEEAAASPALARAFGDLLRVEGAPKAAAERYLERAAQKGVDDPELAYTLGELALREGQKPEALAHLADAVRHDGEPGHAPLVRAHYRLAALAREAGRQEDLRKECDIIHGASPNHDRAHALCANDSGVDLGVVPRADASVVAVAVAAEKTLAPPPLAKAHDLSLAPPTSNDYKTLIREADRLSEGGRSVQARKLYEHALEIDPKGTAALTGLGYCDLDAERFLQSVDRFNAALAIDPNDGDAMIGLAESYKVRGQNARAIELYRKYLATNPGGSKAQMARQNLRELDPHPPNAIEIMPKDVGERNQGEKPKDESPVSQTPPDEPPP
jgi:predicted Zn finger-like uncharacterized protein